MKIRAGSPVFQFTNRLTLQGTSTLLDEITILAALASGLDEEMLRQRRSTIYQLYQEQFNISVIHTADRPCRAVADEARAHQLGIPTCHPRLLVVSLATTFGDKPVELRRSYCSGPVKY
ncbi:MAG: UTRA domain-containing protein [Proteobacteria bacterium]|nr:UTRA domain-containing protein [Pseudomonadota bacterium]